MTYYHKSIRRLSQALLVIALLACAVKAHAQPIMNGEACGGDLCGSFPNCNVCYTHLLSPLTTDQGGTSQGNPQSARGANGLDIDAMPNPAPGDANYTILNTDRTVGTTVAFTGARTWTLPQCSTLNPGHQIEISDHVGTITAVNTLTITADTTVPDLINGAATLVLNAAYSSATLTCAGISHWALKGTNGCTGSDLHTAASGTYPKSNGASPAVFAASTLPAAGTGSCTNQVVTANNGDAAPTCANVPAAALGTQSSVAGFYRTFLATAGITATTTNGSSTFVSVIGGANNTVEAATQMQLPGIVTIKNVYLSCAAAPGASNSYGLTLREASGKGGAASGVGSFAITTNNTTTASDTSHSYTTTQSKFYDWDLTLTVGGANPSATICLVSFGSDI